MKPLSSLRQLDGRELALIDELEDLGAVALDLPRRSAHVHAGRGGVGDRDDHVERCGVARLVDGENRNGTRRRLGQLDGEGVLGDLDRHAADHHRYAGLGASGDAHGFAERNGVEHSRNAELGCRPVNDELDSFGLLSEERARHGDSHLVRALGQRWNNPRDLVAVALDAAHRKAVEQELGGAQVSTVDGEGDLLPFDRAGLEVYPVGDPQRADIDLPHRDEERTGSQNGEEHREGEDPHPALRRVRLLDPKGDRRLACARHLPPGPAREIGGVDRFLGLGRLPRETPSLRWFDRLRHLGLGVGLVGHQ